MIQILLLLTLISSLFGENNLTIHLFWSKDCEYCHEIMNKFLPPLLEKYKGKIELKTYEITANPENYKLLTKFESEYGVYDNPIPVIFVSKYVLGGKEKIESELPKILEDKFAGKPIDTKRLGKQEQAQQESTQVSKKPVYLIYFYKIGCTQCDRVSIHLKYLEQTYTELRVERLDIEKKENKLLNEALCIKLGLAENEHLVAPSIFFDDTALVGKGIKTDRLTKIVEEKSILGNRPPREIITETELKIAEGNIKSRLARFSPLVVISAGILDGINPCAFATIAFFIVFLSAIGRGRKEILLVGASFAAAVFLTYFLLGLGFLNFLKAIFFIKAAAKVIYGLGGIVAIVFGVISFYDAIKARKGKFKDIILQLPEPIKRKIHRIIIEENESRRHRNYIIMAASTGFIISLLELACTGQVYLPTILFLLGEKGLRTKAIFYLFLYNIMFIVPLLGVFTVFFLGASSEKINIFTQKSASTVKLLTGIFFVVLGFFLLRTII